MEHRYSVCYATNSENVTPIQVVVTVLLVSKVVAPYVALNRRYVCVKVSHFVNLHMV